jgi:hypothetical protein
MKELVQPSAWETKLGFQVVTENYVFFSRSEMRDKYHCGDKCQVSTTDRTSAR